VALDQLAERVAVAAPGPLDELGVAHTINRQGRGRHGWSISWLHVVLKVQRVQEVQNAAWLRTARRRRHSAEVPPSLCAVVPANARSERRC